MILCGLYSNRVDWWKCYWITTPNGWVHLCWSCFMYIHVYLIDCNYSWLSQKQNNNTHNPCYDLEEEWSYSQTKNLAQIFATDWLYLKHPRVNGDVKLGDGLSLLLKNINCFFNGLPTMQISFSVLKSTWGYSKIKLHKAPCSENELETSC